MRVSAVECSNFMVRGSAALNLPQTGVVVISGANGAGKSRFIESVANAVWGRSLRGKPPWIDDLPGAVIVHADGHVIKRAATAAGNLRVTFDGESADTNTKTQPMIDAFMGSFEIWRRTHVFSSSDALHFSDATDATRKDLIESLLGLTAFDRGGEQCSLEIAAATKALDYALAVQRAAIAGLARSRLMLTGWASVAPFEAEPKPVWVGDMPEYTSEDAAQNISDYVARIASLKAPATSEAHDQCLRQTNLLRQAVLDWRARLLLAQGGKCSTCAQDYVLCSVAGAHTALRKAEEQCAAQDIVWRDTLAAHQAEQARARLDEINLRNELGQWHAIAATIATHERHYAAHLQVCSAFDQRQELRRAAHRTLVSQSLAKKQLLGDAVAYDQASLASANASYATAAQHVLELTEAARVLRAVRARVLATTLDGISQVANTWLARIAGPDISLQLSGYGETQAGKITDKISLEVRGYGGGHGYRAASGGQRRRVDAALLFALAEVGAAAAGAASGTLWMDEVFDAMDQDGQASVAAALAELGQTRSVVVITHSQALARNIPAVARYTIAYGSITEGTLND